MSESAIRRICVFCGSKPGDNPIYREASRSLGRLLAERGIGLVFGGGSVGLMGIISDTVLELGGAVTGVIPEQLATKELLHSGVADMHVTHSMHARKARMAELSDAFIAMPGGFGTFEELCEMITWAQLGIQQKPVGLLNVAGFFDALVAFFEHAIAEGFIKQQNRRLFVVAPDPSELLDQLLRHEMPAVRRWVTVEES